MQALIDLPSPSNSLPSLREFYDSTKGHIRSLSSLGKSEESYGSLLIPIILGKLPAKVKKNLVRAHEWTITELQTAILNELYIFEMGSQTEVHIDLPPTATFHMGARKPTTGATRKPQSRTTHIAKVHILPPSVMLLRNQNSDVILYAEKSSVLIV